MRIGEHQISDGYVQATLSATVASPTAATTQLMLKVLEEKHDVRLGFYSLVCPSKSRPTRPSFYATTRAT